MLSYWKLESTMSRLWPLKQMTAARAANVRRSADLWKIRHTRGYSVPLHPNPADPVRLVASRVPWSGLRQFRFQRGGGHDGEACLDPE
jgi:hypothetical protein